MKEHLGPGEIISIIFDHWFNFSILSNIYVYVSMYVCICVCVCVRVCVFVCVCLWPVCVCVCVCMACLHMYGTKCKGDWFSVYMYLCIRIHVCFDKLWGCLVTAWHDCLICLVFCQVTSTRESKVNKWNIKQGKRSSCTWFWAKTSAVKIEE